MNALSVFIFGAITLLASLGTGPTTGAQLNVSLDETPILFTQHPPNDQEPLVNARLVANEAGGVSGYVLIVEEDEGALVDLWIESYQVDCTLGTLELYGIDAESGGGFTLSITPEQNATRPFEDVLIVDLSAFNVFSSARTTVPDSLNLAPLCGSA